MHVLSQATTTVSVLWQVDDLGFGDVGWRADSTGAGDGVGTPTLDALRRSGVTLRHFYTPKDCAPSRAATMTGR